MTDKIENNNQKLTIIQRVFKMVPLLSMLGIIVGVIGGYIYHLQVGCGTGA
jgi:hypothetical protein